MIRKRDRADEAVRNVSLASDAACKHRFSSRGIHEHAAGKAQDRSVLSGFEHPLAICSFITGTDASRQEQRGSRLGSCGGEHGVKAGPINVPAASIRVLNKILVAGSRPFPRRSDSVRWQWSTLEEPFPDSQFRQLMTNHRRQGLSYPAGF